MNVKPLNAFATALVVLLISTARILAQSPSFTQQSATNLTLFGGGGATLSVVAVGGQPIDYQWYSNDVAIAAATASNFLLADVQPPNTLQTYFCVASNSVGTATSAVVSVTIVPDPTAVYPSAVLADHPIGFWRLNEQGPDGQNGPNNGAVAHDYWGGNNGIYTNTLLDTPGYNPTGEPTETAAEFGFYSFTNCMVFSIPTNVDFSAPNGANSSFSVECWVNGYAQTSDAGIVSKGISGGEQFDLDTGSHIANSFGGTDHDFRFFVRDASGATHGVNSTNGPDGQWHYLVGVCDEAAGYVALYEDGVLLGTNTISPGSGILASDQGMKIGSRPAGSNPDDNADQFAGSIADVAVYNSALSAAQVQVHYSGGDHPPYFTESPPNSVSADENGKLIIPAEANGAAPLGYQWYLNGDPASGGIAIAGQTNATFMLETTPVSYNGQTLYLVVTNAYGTNEATVSVNVYSGTAQFLTNLPPTVSVLAGRTYTYSVFVTNGTEPFSYQWYANSTPVADATNASYTFPAADGQYYVAVTNPKGTVNSTVSTLTTYSPPTTAYATNIVALKPVGYWPMHEVEAPAPGDTETNYGTLGVLGTGYYPDWATANGNIIQRQAPGVLTNDNDAAVHFTHLVNSGTTVTWTSGLFVPHTSPLATLNPPFTVECWFYPTNIGPGAAIWGQSDYEGLNAGPAGGRVNYNGIILNWANGTFVPYGFNNMNGGIANANKLNGNGSPAEPTNQWYQVVVVADANTNFTLFVNGSKVAGPTADAGKYSADYWSPLSIGSALAGQRSIAGYVDEFSVYTTNLGASDIATHYNDALNGAAGAYFAAVTNDNPVIYLRMDSSPYFPPPVSSWPVLTNYGSAGPNGVYSPGTVPGVVAGPANFNGESFSGLSGGNVAQFSGVSSYADAGYDPEFDPIGPVPFTVTAMFRGNPCDNRSQTIVGHTTSSWRLWVQDTGNIAWQLGGNTLTSTGIYNDGNWHQVVAVYQPASDPSLTGTNLLYVDGVLDNSVSTVSTNGIGNSPADVMIGTDPQYTNNPAGVGQQFAGQVCEVALFTNALTAGQVQTLYNVSQEGPPAIVTQPVGGSVNGGAHSYFPFTVVAGSLWPLSYQWYFNANPDYSGATKLVDNGTHYLNATTAQLTVTNLTGNDSGYYFVIVTNNYGSVTSLLADLTVSVAPEISGQSPVPYTNPFTLFAGASPTFSVSASGATPLFYYWVTNGVVDGAAAGPSLTLDNLAIGLITNYCIVSNHVGSVTSAVWTASVITAPTAPYAQAVLAADPVGYWRLNEPDDGTQSGDGNAGVIAHDYWGGNNGVYTNTGLGGYYSFLGTPPPYSPLDPSTTPAGFGLTSTDSDVYGIDGIDFSAPTNTSVAFSIEAWVNGGSQGTNAGIVSKGYGGAEQFDLDTGGPANAEQPLPHNFRFMVRDALGASHTVNSSIQPGNVWHHLVGVCDEANSNVTLYVDGVAVGQAAIAPGSGILASDRAMLIGSRPSGPATDNDDQFIGFLQDVAVYNYALSASQVEAQYYSAGIAPFFTQQPPNTTNVDLGGTLTIPTTVNGTPPLSYQWNLSSSGSPIVGQTNATLVISNVDSSYLNQSVYLTATNAYGSTNSSPTIIVVYSGAPQITADLQPQYFAPAYGTVVLSVTAYGTAPLHYQWQFSSAGGSNWINLTDSSQLAGSASNTLTLTDVQPARAGNYQLVITNADGSITSSVANLAVWGPTISFNSDAVGWIPNGHAQVLTGSNAVMLTDGGANERSGFFFQYPQYIGGFQASFTYQTVPNSNPADGTTFCIQNDPRGALALGGNGGQLGVGSPTPIIPSIELEINLRNKSGQVRGYTVLTNGLTGVNGGNGNYRALGSVNLESGDPIDVSVFYADGQMALTFTDSVAGTSFSTNLDVGDIMQLLNSDTAFIGFTGSDGGAYSIQTVSNFKFLSIPPAGIRVAGANALVLWPGAVAGYRLQQNPDLSTTNWVNATDQSILTNGLNQVTVPMNGTNLFYRLVYP